ncbi:MAG: enoyl-CoA hydratase/isomerase family protein [Lachnospiraceae bacterium]|nr:enoyl-CoA hydratase/isomerase family protein [Lachnospiraceae bacterium]
MGTIKNFKNLKFEMVHEKFALLTINRPEVLNALNIETFHELNELMEILENSKEIKGLIITGTGRSFVAGADLGECADALIEENRAYAELAQSTFSRLEALPIPTIAAVNGFALGGGCELSLACDIRIAGEKARFGQPEVDLGVIPCFGGTQRLPRLIGTGLAKEMIFTGRKVMAGEAKEMGLVNKVVPQDALLEEAAAMMEVIVSKSHTAVKYAKAAIDHGRDMALADGLEFEKDLSAICYGLPDKAEGVKAFFEKRKPEFKS